jgi:hypothetical protein
MISTPVTYYIPSANDLFIVSFAPIQRFRRLSEGALVPEKNPEQDVGLRNIHICTSRDSDPRDGLSFAFVL